MKNLMQDVVQFYEFQVLYFSLAGNKFVQILSTFEMQTIKHCKHAHMTSFIYSSKAVLFIFII